MKLYDANTDRAYTLPELRSEWLEFRASDPDNHADTFTVELFEVLMATVNGRNDCDVVGMTAPELNRYIINLMSKVKGGEHV